MHEKSRRYNVWFRDTDKMEDRLVGRTDMMVQPQKGWSIMFDDDSFDEVRIVNYVDVVKVAYHCSDDAFALIVTNEYGYESSIKPKKEE